MNFLTDGDIKYWKNERTNYYVSFDKKTLKILHYDSDMYVDYLNGLDFMAKGQSFRIKNDSIYTNWIVKEHNIIIPIDTFIIKSISQKGLELFSKKDSISTKYVVCAKTKEQLRLLKINPIQQWGYKRPEMISDQNDIANLVDELYNLFEDEEKPFPEDFTIKVTFQVDKTGKIKNAKVHEVQPPDKIYSPFYNDLIIRLKKELKFIPAHNTQTGEYYDSENFMLPIHYSKVIPFE